MINFEITENETNRELTITEENNLWFFLFDEITEYNSYMHLAYRKEEEFVGYAGTINTKNYDDYEPFFNGIPNDRDIYITPNGMKTDRCRTSKAVINLQNIVIDIDSHDEKEIVSIEQMKEFTKNLTENISIKPNMINYTGRGIHLWYRIYPCHIKLEKIYLSVVKMICNEIENYMKEIKEDKLKLDTIASEKTNGLIRLPYSYNTKSKTWSEVVMIHKDIKTITEIKEILKSKEITCDFIKDEDKKKRKKEPMDLLEYYQNTRIKDGDYTPCLLHRKQFLYDLIESGNLHDRRNNTFFLLFQTLRHLYDDERAIKMCRKLNRTIDNPLTNKELNTIFNQRRYRISNWKFLRLLNTKKSEHIAFTNFNSELLRQAKREVKAEKYREAKELYLDGKSITEVSKITGISRPTIYKIIKE